MGDNNRTEILSFPVNAVSPTKIQLPDGIAPFKKITASMQSGLHSFTIFAPNSNSPSKTFSIGAEYPYQNGPYQSGDVLGWYQLDSNSDVLILHGER